MFAVKPFFLVKLAKNTCNISTSGSRRKTITTPASNLRLEVASWFRNRRSDHKFRKHQNSTYKQIVIVTVFSQK